MFTLRPCTPYLPEYEGALLITIHFLRVREFFSPRTLSGDNARRETVERLLWVNWLDIFSAIAPAL